LRQVGGRDGCARLGDEFGAQLLAFGLDRDLELFEAPRAQSAVGRPAGLVEGAPGGGDRAAHVLLGAVGDLAQHLFGGGVDVVELGAADRGHQFAVDQHAVFRGEVASRPWFGHRSSPSCGRRDVSQPRATLHIGSVSDELCTTLDRPGR
jgi:hypothetical protein